MEMLANKNSDAHKRRSIPHMVCVIETLIINKTVKNKLFKGK